MGRFPILPIMALAVAAGGAGAAFAQEREVPYWATIRASANVLNMRVGPSEDYPLSWVYRRPGLPVRVVRVHESWRLIQDPDGARGWVASRLLSPDRGAIVTRGQPTAMRDGPGEDTNLKWRLNPGVVGSLGRCSRGWCRFTVGKYHGYVRQARLWGAD